MSAVLAGAFFPQPREKQKYREKCHCFAPLKKRAWMWGSNAAHGRITILQLPVLTTTHSVPYIFHIHLRASGSVGLRFRDFNMQVSHAWMVAARSLFYMSLIAPRSDSERKAKTRLTSLKILSFFWWLCSRFIGMMSCGTTGRIFFDPPLARRSSIPLTARKTYGC